MQPQDPTNPLTPEAPQPPAPAGPPATPPAPGAPTPPAPQPFGPTPPPPTGPAAPGSGPSPFGPQPPQHGPSAPVHGGDAAPSPFSTAPPAPGGKKRTIVIIVIAVAALLLLAGGTYFVTKMLGGNIKLEEFSNENVTMLVPVGYEKTEESGGTTFKEKEGEEGTRSEVVVYYQELPESVTDEDIPELKEALKGQLEEAATSATGENKELKNINITDITFKGSDAFKLTAEAYDDGKKAGTVTLVAGVKDRALFMVGVAAHEGDPGVERKIDEIINSLQLK